MRILHSLSQKRVVPTRTVSLLSSGAVAQALLHLTPAVRLLGQVDREVLELEDLADLAVALLTVTPRGVHRHEPLGPLDRLIPRPHLDDGVAGDQLLRFREGSVDDRALASGVPHPDALRARMEPLAREDHAGLQP